MKIAQLVKFLPHNMKTLAIILALLLVACQPAYICLYEYEVTNNYAPPKSFRSYRVDAQRFYCSNSFSPTSDTTSSDSKGAHSIKRLLVEVENTPDNRTKINQQYDNLIQKESTHDCSVHTPTK